MRITFKTLVVNGMGYCCTWAFFRVNQKVAHIAVRLGITVRAVYYHRCAFEAGTMRCENSARCMKARLVRATDAGLIPPEVIPPR